MAASTLSALRSPWHKDKLRRAEAAVQAQGNPGEPDPAPAILPDPRHRALEPRHRQRASSL